MSELSKILPESTDFRAAIMAAEAILKDSCEQISPEVIHHFAPGIYMREMRIKKGTILTGKIHKTEHLCVLNGDIEIASEDGKGRFTGYLTFLSKPGVKRIGYAHEDTVFTTVHATYETDIERLEKSLAVDSFEEYDLHVIHEDFDAFLRESGLSIELVSLLSKSEYDQIPMPDEFINKLEKWPSLIADDGLFVATPIKADEYIAPARLSGKRTPAGRYINHSPFPNTKIVALENEDLQVYAIRPIKAGEELTIDYRQSALMNAGLLV